MSRGWHGTDMNQLDVAPDGTVTQKATGKTWPSMKEFIMEVGQNLAESLGISDVAKTIEVAMEGNTVIAKNDKGENLRSNVTPKMAAALQESDFGRKEPYWCHVAISEGSDYLFVWKRHGEDDNEKIFQGECPSILSQILIGLGVGYDY